MALILGINTTTPHLALALVEDGRLVAELGRDVGNEHAEAIFVLLETLFTWTGRTRAELTAIGVVVGPGGFTGVRTGLAVAKTIAQVLGIPVYGVETLEALADQFPGVIQLTPMLDARRGLVFAALYEWVDGRWIVEVPPHLVSFEAWRDAMAAKPVHDLLWVGEGASRYREAILAPFDLPVPPMGWRVPADALMVAGAASVALIAERRLLAGEPTDGVTLAPQYLREPQAVVNWDALHPPEGVPTHP